MKSTHPVIIGEPIPPRQGGHDLVPVRDFNRVAFLELCREVGALNRKGQSSAQLGMK